VALPGLAFFYPALRFCCIVRALKDHHGYNENGARPTLQLEAWVAGLIDKHKYGHS
jgi:hypothetical protein